MEAAQDLAVESDKSYFAYAHVLATNSKGDNGKFSEEVIRIADIHERQTKEQSGRRGLAWRIRPKGRYPPEANEFHEA
eukprot:3101934-Karenia_brevis.AAC.1